MNTAQLANAVAASTGIPVAAAHDAVKATFALIADGLADGESISIPGFGTFSATVRQARQGRNPQTGEAIEIPEMRTPTFRATPSLKRQVRELN